MDEKLDIKQAYVAMYTFLDMAYKNGWKEFPGFSRASCFSTMASPPTRRSGTTGWWP